MGYQHVLKLDYETAESAYEGLQEFGEWSRRRFLNVVSNGICDRRTLFAGNGSRDIVISELSQEMLEDHPHGYDWTGISNVMLLHSPNQVVYVSIENPNETKFRRLDMEAQAESSEWCTATS